MEMVVGIIWVGLILIWVFVSAVCPCTASSPSSSSSSSVNNNGGSCPMDLSYVQTIPWNSFDCYGHHLSANTSFPDSNSDCCQTLLSLYGIALAQHLQSDSDFGLPDLPTSVSCLSDLQSQLNILSLPSNLTSICFHPSQFVTSPKFCAGVETKQDWLAKLGPNTSLDTACRLDLTDPTLCDSCLAAGFKVQRQLVSIDGNTSHSVNCFYVVVLYAAGVVNEYGPLSDGVLSCVFGLQLLASQTGTQSKNSHHVHVGLVHVLFGAGGALFVLSLLGLCYFCYNRIWRRKAGSGVHYGPVEIEMRPSLLPNTATIWFGIEELKQVTDNFSQKNLIGRGGFSVVYKGKLPDGALVAVKKILDSDFQGHHEFCNEVEIISNLKHRNLVPLRGCCLVDGGEDNEEIMRSASSFLITDWAWSLVKEGKVEEVFDASLVRKGEGRELYPKAIMERFVLVGILCSHIMVALRPSILDVLKMLEGDIEVPPIPDRPMPLGDPSFSGDSSGFTVSPRPNSPQFGASEMLRHLRRY
ncbi:hypothetical protein Dimus_018105 [Dionaea muscipula]